MFLSVCPFTVFRYRGGGVGTAELFLPFCFADSSRLRGLLLLHLPVLRRLPGGLSVISPFNPFVSFLLLLSSKGEVSLVYPALR